MHDQQPTGEPPRQRLALVLEFDGYPFCGWQQQENGPSVQAELQRALTRLDGQSGEIVAAGRTDAGVHAEAMLVHADVRAERLARTPNAYLHGLNSLLPTTIRVVAIRLVEQQFHARFDCRGRGYRYLIWNRSTPTALAPFRHWWMPRRVDLAAMQQAAEYLVGKYDFSSFRASQCQASTPVRTLRLFEVQRVGWQIELVVRGDGFLHHQVRNMVGTLVEVGLGKRQPDEIPQLLAACNRNLAGATAPAHGLYFMDAVYDAFSSAELARCQSPVVSGQLSVQKAFLQLTTDD